MIGQILPNKNERCYSNFSPTFREVNTRLVCLVVSYRQSNYATYLFTHGDFIVKFWGYCVLTPILKSNCDFTLVFVTVAILPLLCNWEGSVYPYS
jgi:hypothetical protein